MNLYYMSKEIYQIPEIVKIRMELAWRSGCVMDCHATTRGSIPGGNGVKTELHVLCSDSKRGCCL